MKLCNKDKERICADKGKGVSIVKRKKRRDIFYRKEGLL